MTQEERVQFYETFDTYFKSSSNAPSLTDDNWEILEVNAERIRSEVDPGELSLSLHRRYSKALIELLARWVKIPVDGNVRKEDLAESLAEHITDNLDDAACEGILFLFEFRRQKRKNAVFSFAQYFLDDQKYRVIEENLTSDTSKLFAFSFAVFLSDETRLRSLMLYSDLEGAGTVRHDLSFEIEDDDENLSEDELIEQANQNIRFDILTRSRVDDALAEYRNESGRETRCFDVFSDIEEDCDAIIFLLRMKGETRIRQIDSVVFEEEAELFVMRFMDGVATVDMHPRRHWDRTLAASMVRDLVDEDRVDYKKSRVKTERTKLQRFLNQISTAEDTTDGDERNVLFYQLKLDNAPVDRNPILELRSEHKARSLAPSLEELNGLGLSLLGDLDDISTFGVSYETNVQGELTRYVFSVDVEPYDDDHVSLPYTDRPPPEACRAFENHMQDTYDIHVFPGDRG